MTLVKTLGTGICLTALCLLATPAAKADESNLKTIVTFSAPVEIPGVGAQTLPAGTYVFKVLNSPAGRHIVQISNQEETHVFTTVIAIPNYRLKSTDSTVMTFGERPAGEPQALKAWFYPGREWGDQFVYDKSEATILARETNQPVLYTTAPFGSEQVDGMNAASVQAVGPTGESVETATVIDAPPVVAPPVVAVAVVAPPPAPVVEAVATVPAPPPTMAKELPRTASNLSLIALLGFLALAGGLAVTGLGKHAA